ncbi:uncharacterized protein LOC110460691, partial [Mizuhopecten yessoensis]|uniref:uncharacterized protein LOC110460691 n=1 Tax=Mizuhopecten yessoensis TaxID=6573 RepID=UPI000B45D1AF
MIACWRYGVLFCNSFLIFGGYYFLQIPISLQNEIMNSHYSYNVSNHTEDQANCNVCLGLGEVRYNILFSIARWTSVVICLPFGFLIDRLGNSRSAILFSIMCLLGSVLFTVGTMTHPATTPSYVLMVVGFACLTVGDGPLRCVASCGFGVLCAVGLVFLLQRQTPQEADDYQKNTIMTLADFRALPGSYWLWILAVSLYSASWIPKQANLPDYLQLRHGYTMNEASYLTGLSPIMFFLSPLVSLILKRVDCDGIVTIVFIAWMVPVYALLGFCPAINVSVLILADGISTVIVSIMMWQLIVVLCPASNVGTLSGLMFLLRTASIALSFVASGHILKRHNVIDVENAQYNYQHWFIMLIIITSAGVICGTMMNVLDIRK